MADAAPRTVGTWNRLGAAGLVVMVLLAYLPAMGGGFIWDDDDYVTDNPHLRTLTGLGKIWFDVEATPQYYPLVHTSYWIEYHLWGHDPTGYHVDNVLLHALACLLLWRILTHLTVPGAGLAAAMFALHPVQVESVAWITERKNVLSACFYFAALLAFLRFVDPPRARSTDGRWRFYALSLLFFVAALFSKTVTCSLPAAIAVLLLWKKRRIGAGQWLALLPMFAIGVGMGLLTIWIEKHGVGAKGIDWTLTPVERCLVAGRVVWFYLGKLVWPIGLTFIYPRWGIDAGQAWQFLFPIAALTVPVTLWRLRRRIGGGPLVAYLLFIGTLFPAMGFIDVYPMRFSYVADHFQYLASAAAMAGLAALVTRCVNELGGSRRAVCYAVPGLLLAVLAGLSWRQGLIYKNLETLWTDTIAKNPNAWIAHNNLGIVKARQGKGEEALQHYRDALEVKPAYPDALNNVGQYWADRGQWERAAESYGLALKIRPNYAATHFNLGKVQMAVGQIDRALASLRRSIELDGQFAPAHTELGNVLAAMGKLDEAEAAHRRAIEIDPTLPEAHNNLALVLGARGLLDQALQEFGRALKLRPDFVEALGGLGFALAGLDRRDEAVARWRQALTIDPANGQVRCALAEHLERWGRSDQARHEYAQAVKADPRCPCAARAAQILGRAAPSR